MNAAPRITRLKNLCLLTPLADAVIVITPRPAYEAAAREIQRHIGRLVIHYDNDVCQGLVERYHVIALGNLCTNKLVERLYYQWYCNVDLGYPGDGGHVVRSIHDPWGTGKNVILLGGSNDAGIADAARAFLKALPRGHNRTVGWLMDIKLGRGVRDQMESKPHYRGPVCGYGFQYYFSGEERYGRLWRKALLERLRMDDPFEHSHIWFWQPIALWDLLEESPLFSNRDRLTITNLFLQWIESHEGRHFSAFRDDLRRGNLSQPHRTSPALACFFGGRYFQKYYGLKQATAWLSDAKQYFAAQANSSKTMDEPEACTAESLGCGGLMTYALASGDHTCFENGTIREAADRVAMACNNLGVMAAYGDVQSFYSVPSDFFCRVAHYYRDGTYEFLARVRNPWRDRCKPVWREFDHPTPAFHTDVESREPKRLLGVKVAPLARRFWDTYRGNYTYPSYPKTIPYHKSFDKISFRAGFDPDDDYLLLDGVSGGTHGYTDANSILEYTSRSRLWIATADLSYGSDNSGPARHNAVTVLRDGEGALPPGFAALEAHRGSFTHTVLPGYNGVDWHRRITWRPGHSFLVEDELHVKKAGQYRFDCRWHTLGDPRMWGRSLVVDQKGVALHIESGGRARLTLERDGFRGSYFSCQAKFRCWAERPYEYADPILNVLTQTIEGRRRRGDVVRFTNRIRVSRTHSEERVRPKSVSISRESRRKPAGRSRFSNRRMTEVWSWPSDSPIRDAQVADIGIVLALESGKVVSLDSSGCTQWTRGVGSSVNAISVGDINGDSDHEIVAGCDTGSLCALSRHGKLLWKHRIPTLDAGNLWALDTPRVVRVRCADLDDDGRDEILAGVGNLHLHALAGDGRHRRETLDWSRHGLRTLRTEHGPAVELWRRFSWGTWNTFTTCDLDGDGQPEIIGGPGFPPKAAASPALVLRGDGERLAELDVDGWAGGLNALTVGDFVRTGRNQIVVGTIKGNLRMFEPPRRLGEKLPLRRGQVVVDHTSGQNATSLLRPPKVVWERNLGDLITGLAAVPNPATQQFVFVVASATGYVSAFTPGGRKLWARNMGSSMTILRRIASAVAIGCESGRLSLLDQSGSMLAEADLHGSVRILVPLPSALGILLLAAARGGNKTTNRLVCLRA